MHLHADDYFPIAGRALDELCGFDMRVHWFSGCGGDRWAWRPGVFSPHSGSAGSVKSTASGTWTLPFIQPNKGCSGPSLAVEAFWVLIVFMGGGIRVPFDEKASGTQYQPGLPPALRPQYLRRSILDHLREREQHLLIERPADQL